MPQIENEPCMSKRWFMRLTDKELFQYRPLTSYSPGRNHNVGAANREMRRRAAKLGIGVYSWLNLVAQREGLV